MSADLCSKIPNIKGFSPRNLRYMYSFYATFSDIPILPQVGADFTNISSMPQNDAKFNDVNAIYFNIPWGHIKVILDKYKNDGEKIDHELRKDTDAKTIGLLICKTKDSVLAKYALESSGEPIGISEYEISNALPKEFKGSMPTIEEIENGLAD